MKKNESARPIFPQPAASTQLSRRQFLKRMGLLGGGLVVYIAFGDPPAGARQAADFNAYLKIGADGRVTCFTGKIEMGQGVITSLAQMLADDLDVPLASVDMVMGDTLLCPYDRGTFGSMSTPYFGPILRQAAAEARAVLIQMAAEQLGVPPQRLTVNDGRVTDSQVPNRSLTYAQLTGGKLIERHLKQPVSPLPASRRTVAGKATGRTDARPKVTGDARFAGDIRLPGLLYAGILRPPAHGAILRRVNLEDAANVEGVRVIRDGDLIAALHKYPDVAQKALDILDKVDTKSAKKLKKQVARSSDRIAKDFVKVLKAYTIKEEKKAIAAEKAKAAKPKPSAKPKPQTKPKSQAKPRPTARPKTSAKPKPPAKKQAKKPAVKPAPKSSAKPAPKIVKPAAKPAPKVTKPSTKAAPKPAAKPAPKPRTKAAPKTPAPRRTAKPKAK